MSNLVDDDELLDLVDENDQVIGTIQYTAAYDGHTLNGHYIRAASCFIMNSKGQLWIPRRLPTKRLVPNGLDYSASGHVQAGETYDQAIIREIAEEIGLQVTIDQLIFVGKELPAETPPHYYFSQVYLYFSDVEPTYNPADFSGFEWLMPAELQARIAAGDTAKHSLPVALKLVLAYLTEHGRH